MFLLTSLSNNKGTAAILEINKPMKKVTAVSSVVFDSNFGMFPSLSKIDDRHYLCAYSGLSRKGQAVVLTVDTATWAINKESVFVFDTVRGDTPALSRIDDENHLCVYEGNFKKGVAVVLTVDTGTWNISKQIPATFEVTRCTSPAVSRIDSQHYILAYAGPSYRGQGVVLNVASFPWSISILSRFEFDSDVGLFPDLEKIEDDRYLCVYEGANSDAWTNVFTVDPGTWKVTPGIAVEYDPVGGESPAAVQIDESHFLCVYQGSNNDGWAAILNTDPPVLP